MLDRRLGLLCCAISCCIVAVETLSDSPATTEPLLRKADREVQTGKDDVSRIGPESNGHALLFEAFHGSGYAPQDASNLATYAIKRLAGEDVNVPTLMEEPKPDSILFGPDTNAHALLVELLVESGHDTEEAVRHVNAMIMRLLGIEPEPFDPQPLGAECWSYFVRAYHCDGEQKITTRHYIHAMCWEAIVMSPCSHYVECGEFEYPHYTLTPSCLGVGRARFMTTLEPTNVPCHFVDIGCDCIDEVDENFEVDCGSIDYECCSSTPWQGDCSDCPE